MGIFKENESFASKAAKIGAMVVGGLALAVLLGFLFGLVVKALWNWLMPELFGLKEISYWQAWGLVVLSHILIKPGYGGNGGGKSKEKKTVYKECLKDGSGKVDMELKVEP